MFKVRQSALRWEIYSRDRLLWNFIKIKNTIQKLESEIRKIEKMKLVEIDIADILNGGEERLQYWSKIVIQQFKEVGFLR